MPLDARGDLGAERPIASVGQALPGECERGWKIRPPGGYRFQHVEGRNPRRADHGDAWKIEPAVSG